MVFFFNVKKCVVAQKKVEKHCEDIRGHQVPAAAVFSNGTSEPSAAYSCFLTQNQFHNIKTTIDENKMRTVAMLMATGTSMFQVSTGWPSGGQVTGKRRQEKAVSSLQAHRLAG